MLMLFTAWTHSASARFQTGLDRGGRLRGSCNCAPSRSTALPTAPHWPRLTAPRARRCTSTAWATRQRSTRYRARCGRAYVRATGADAAYPGQSWQGTATDTIERSVYAPLDRPLDPWAGPAPPPWSERVLGRREVG